MSIDSNFFNKYLSPSQQLQQEKEAEETESNVGSTPIDTLKELFGNNYSEDSIKEELKTNESINIFSVGFDSAAKKQGDKTVAEILSQLDTDSKHNNNVSDSRISEIVNTVEDYEDLINSINYGHEYLDTTDYSQENDTEFLPITEDNSSSEKNSKDTPEPNANLNNTNENQKGFGAQPMGSVEQKELNVDLNKQDWN
ncbi:hypothetical protein II906_04210 [bacterium]|nr:hypothetical protein [bacterium]